MMNKIFDGKENIKDFVPDPGSYFSYDINPVFWYRRGESKRYDTFPLTFFNYFFSLETLEKIGGNGVWLVSKELSHLTKHTWGKVLKKKYLAAKPVSKESFCRDDLLEAGIPEYIVKDERMNIVKFDAGKCWKPAIRDSILAVVGIIYWNEFIPIWWDPFGRFKFH